MTRINLDTTAKIWRCALPPGCNKLVLQAFAHHINSDETHPHHGLAWPSIQRVALMCGMSPRTVRDHVRALRTAGLLRPKWRIGVTTLYAVITSGLQPLVFSGDAVELDADGNAVDNSASSCPAPATFAPATTDSGTESTEICNAEYANSHPIALGISDSKQEDSQNPPAPASPVPPYPLFEEVKPETLADFAVCRKEKFGRGAKGKVTEALIAKIAGEATLAGLTLQAALEYCCHPERRWASFKAGWLKPKTSAPAAPAPVKVWEPDTTPIPPAAPAIQPPPAKSYSPEIAAAALAAYKAKHPPTPAATPTPAAAPAMPTGASDIRIAADAPQWAVTIVTKHRSGQPVSRNSLHEACSVLKISPSLLRASPLFH